MTSSARTTARASRAAERRLERNHPRRARARRSFARSRRARASGPPLSSPRVVARRRRRRDVRFRAHPPRRRRDLTARARRADAQTRPFFSSRAPPAPGVPRRASRTRAARRARRARVDPLARARVRPTASTYSARETPIKVESEPTNADRLARWRSRRAEYGVRDARRALNSRVPRVESRPVAGARAPRLFEFLDVSDLEYEIIDRSGLNSVGLPIGAIQIRPLAALRSPRVTARRDMSSPAKENPASGDGGVKTPSSVRAAGERAIASATRCESRRR